MKTIDWQTIERNISNRLGQPLKLSQFKEIHGGCINRTFVVENGQRSLFIKLNREEMLSVFEAEAVALEEIAGTKTIRVPSVVDWGVSAGIAYLALENLELQTGGRVKQHDLGESLAKMHLLEYPYFGWQRDNAIGSTPQPNTRTGDWVHFWKTQRLGFQLDLALRNGYGGRMQESGGELLANLEKLFAGHRPSPSLLHGDLWSGNAAITQAGENVIFDPASYYGDHECDLAMTELFGGFNSEFHAAYASTYPLDEGYAIRKLIYNLYHLLNHVNIFGGGYLRQTESTIERLLLELR